MGLFGKRGRLAQTQKMNFLARVARFLLWLILISWSVWLLRRLAAWVLRDGVISAAHSADVSSPAETAVAARKLVRDPVCGMHVDETRSIPLREGGELLHFCSTACRDAYAGNVKKLAANG
jgi:YHS domain-containing protein